MYVIKWENRYSKETGYVEKINRKFGFFENTFERANAGIFKTKGNAIKAISWLKSSKEGENNEFFLEEISD